VDKGLPTGMGVTEVTFGETISWRCTGVFIYRRIIVFIVIAYQSFQCCTSVEQLH
jgi:hypothetical protein